MIRKRKTEMNTAGRTLAALTALLLAVLLLAAGCGGPSEAELRAARADEEARSYAASLPSFDKDLLLSWMTEAGLPLVPPR